MDPNQLADFIMQKKWIALTAFIIGLVVRLLKSDTKIPIDIPPRLRAPLAVSLGAVAGAIDKLVQQGDTTWTIALVSGFSAAFAAMVSHSLFIESARGGKELVVPGLIKENTPPGPGKPPSIPPTADNKQTMKDVSEGKDVDTSGLIQSIYRGPIASFMPSVFPRFIAESVCTITVSPRLPSMSSMFKPTAAILAIAAMAFCVNGCHFFSPAELPGTVLTLEEIGCIIEHAFVDDKTLNTVCNLLSPAQQEAAKRVATAHRADVARKMSAMRAEACGDGGAK